MDNNVERQKTIRFLGSIITVMVFIFLGVGLYCNRVSDPVGALAVVALASLLSYGLIKESE